MRERERKSIDKENGDVKISVLGNIVKLKLIHVFTLKVKNMICALNRSNNRFLVSDTFLFPHIDQKQ